MIYIYNGGGNWQGTMNLKTAALIMQKYGGKQIFSHGSFPEVIEKQKKKKKIGENNGQLRIRGLSVGPGSAT